MRAGLISIYMKTIDNKYLKWYNMLIDRARTRTLDGYGEWHHVIPRSLGGVNNTSNLVHLTAREHLIAHMLLPRFLDDSKKMWQALWCMVNMGKVKVTGRLYEQARTIHAAHWAFEHKLPCRKGIAHTPETRAKMSAANKGRYPSLETRAKMSEWQIGKKHSPETRAKISAVKKGRATGPRTEEVKAKISTALKGIKRKPLSAEKRAQCRAALQEARKAKAALRATREAEKQSLVLSS